MKTVLALISSILAFVLPSSFEKLVPQDIHPDSGMIPITKASISPKVIEIEAATPGSSTRLGANQYPKSQGGLDPVQSVPLFPVDPLSYALGFMVPQIVNAPLIIEEPTTKIDWVKDTLLNTDPPSLASGIASGIIDGVSGTLYNGQKRGHWNGARIVDGIAGAEQDQFVKGGKEDDTSTWTIGGGSVGSAKYDLTQVFIADSTFPTTDLVNFPSGYKSVLYFEMERRGNTGTTAFDFEFNQKPPINDYIPNRSEGDVLFTFELNGSTSGGSATPHVYIYHNGSFLDNEFLAKQVPAARRPGTSINQVATPGAPWGYVNEKGKWTIGQIPLYSAAEGQVPFGIDFLENVNHCGGLAFVQIRTRSSVTKTSDLKDLTKIFAYSFSAGPKADLQLESGCGQSLGYAAAGSHDGEGGSNLTYDWTFRVPAGVTLTSVDPEFGLDPNDPTKFRATFTSDTVRNIEAALPVGIDYVDVPVSLRVVGGEGCFDSTTSYMIRVYRTLDVTVLLSSSSGTPYAIDFGSTSSGGNGPISYSWKFYKRGAPDVQVGTSTAASGTFTVPSAGDYYAVLTIKDTAATSSDSHVIAKPQCSATKTTSTVTVSDPPPTRVSR